VEFVKVDAGANRKLKSDRKTMQHKDGSNGIGWISYHCKVKKDS